MTTRCLLLLLLLLGAAPAFAQQPQDERAERLEAENAALRLELRMLRDRLTSIDERLTSLAGRAPWPGPGARGPDAPPDGQDAAVSEDGSMVLVRDARLPDDGGASSPEELAEFLHAALAGPDDGREAALARVGAFAAEDPSHGFLVPTPLWAKVSPEGATPTPSWGGLTTLAAALADATRGSRLAGVRVASGVAAPRPTAPAPAAPAALSPGEPVLTGTLLGVAGEDWSDSSGRRGLRIKDILAGSPAETAGLRDDDLIQTLAHQGVIFPVLSMEDLRQVLASLPPGSPVVVGVRRGSSIDTTAYFGTYSATVSIPVQLGNVRAPAPPPPPPPAAAGPATPAPSRDRPTRSASLDLSGPGGNLTLEVAMVRVNGRWLVASVDTDWVDAHARGALERMLVAWRELRNVHLHVEELVTAQAFCAKLTESGMHARPLAPGAFELPGYRVSFVVDLQDRELWAVARPASQGHPVLLLGPVPGETDLNRNPYCVRARK